MFPLRGMILCMGEPGYQRGRCVCSLGRGKGGWGRGGVALDSAQINILRLFAKADSTLRSSQAVPHPSTNRALRRLTSEVRRDPVHSTRYGRQRQIIFNMYQMFLTWKKDGTHHSEDASVYWQECSVSSNLGGHCSLLGKILKLHLQRSRHRANVFSHLPAAPHACQHFI